MTNISMILIMVSLIANANDEPYISLIMWIAALVMYIAGSVLKKED